MKTPGILLFLALLSISAFSQNSLGTFDDFQPKSNQLDILAENLGFTVSSKITDGLPAEGLLKLNSKTESGRQSQPSPYCGFLEPVFPMPILTPSNQDNMPVWNPESNVTFFIQNKQIDFYNPLKKQDSENSSEE